MLINVGYIHNELYYKYKIKKKKKYDKEINSLNTKNKEKLDYKKLRLADIYDYLSDEEQKEILEQKQKEKQEEKQEEKQKEKQKEQKKSQKKTHFLNILRMKQKMLTMVCLIIILIL